MKILLLLLFLVLGGGMLILAILRGIGQLIFGKPVSSSQSGYSNANNRKSSNTDTYQSPQKKVFDRNEGEYVKYEEVKD